jgi:hypothetical protein
MNRKIQIEFEDGRYKALFINEQNKCAARQYKFIGTRAFKQDFIRWLHNGELLDEVKITK